MIDQPKNQIRIKQGVESLRPGGFLPLRGSNLDADEVFTADDYEFELASASAETVRTVTDLLATVPRVEIGPPIHWGAYSALALSGRDTIALRKKRMMAV